MKNTGIIIHIMSFINIDLMFLFARASHKNDLISRLKNITMVYKLIVLQILSALN